MARSPIEELQRQIAKLREQIEQLLNGPVEPRTTSADARAARELEDISIVLADRASSLEAINAEERVPHGGLAGWQQKRLVEYIAKRLDKKISLTDLANVAKLSRYHFARAFKQSFGEPPHRYIMRRRIERAKTLLENPAASVTDIAIEVGFADPVSFASAFRRSVGTTPTNYRRGIK